MKQVIYLFLSLLGIGQAMSQATWERSFELGGSQAVRMDFRYPELIKINTWSQNSVKIKASVMINLGNNNDAFKITSTNSNGTLYITSEIENHEDLPEYTIVHLNDQEFLFTGGWQDPELQKFLDEHRGESISWISSGVQKDISLEITVPENAQLDIYSRHGLIEFANLPRSVLANSRHRGIDVTVGNTLGLEFELYSKHGEIFTNLDLDFQRQGSRFRNSKDTFVQANYNGGGNKMVFETRHGNIYLRAKN